MAVSKRPTKYRQLLVAVLALLLLFVAVMAIYRNFSRPLQPNAPANVSAQQSADSQDAWARDWLEVLQGIASVLETVKDSSSAKAAAPNLLTYVNRIDQLAERQKKLPRVTNSENDKILNRYMPEMLKVKKRMTDLVPTLREKYDAVPALTDAMEKIMAAAGKLQRDGSTPTK